MKWTAESGGRRRECGGQMLVETEKCFSTTDNMEGHYERMRKLSVSKLAQNKQVMGSCGLPAYFIFVSREFKKNRGLEEPNAHHWVFRPWPDSPV